MPPHELVAWTEYISLVVGMIVGLLTLVQGYSVLRLRARQLRAALRSE